MQSSSAAAANSASAAHDVAITGASGLVGSALIASLRSSGSKTLQITRNQQAIANDVATWDPEQGFAAPERLNGVKAVVHLAGENIAGGRWTAARKRRIRDSRVHGTTTLCRTLAGLERKPEVLVCASAIGFYGDHGDEALDESSAAGEGFLPEVCQEWEGSTAAAAEAGIRVVLARFGLILSRDGGALTPLLLQFKLGAGGRVGDGRQYWSWIDIDDVVGAIRHAISAEGLSGPVNVVAPHPVTNAEFTKVLGKVLHRPTLLPLPGFMARTVMGQMADDLLLASARVQPRRLQASGYQFRFSDLESALRHELRR